DVAPGDLKIIFAVKLRRLRKAQKFTLADLSARSGLSISYLAEIEGAKKYPKPDRLLRLASALGCPYDDLTSTRLERYDEALQQFLDAEWIRGVPLQMFGIPPEDLMKLLIQSPSEVSALLRGLTDLAREHNIGPEHFVYALLRSYQKLTGNFDELI